jgi:hypothetical protein
MTPRPFLTTAQARPGPANGNNNPKKLTRRGAVTSPSPSRRYCTIRVNLPRFTWGTGMVEGMFGPVLDHAGRDYWPFLLRTNGTAEIQLRSLGLRPPFDDLRMRHELLRQLDQIPGVSIPEDAVTRRPRIRLALLAASPEALACFMGVLDWVCEMVRSSAEDRPEY